PPTTPPLSLHDALPIFEVARFLQSHPKVQKVFYPGLESHPQHALAKRQMNGRYGGMVTAVLKGGLERSRRFLERCKLFTLAESLDRKSTRLNSSHVAIS